MADICICSVDGCDKPKANGRKGFCNGHYKRLNRYGDPSGGPRGQRTPDGVPMQWIKDNLSYDKDECLKWPFADRGNGYGAATDENGKLVGAHNLMCRMAHGDPIEDKDQAAHSCGKGHEGCVNPKHLKWSTHLENMQDKKIHGTQPIGEMHKSAKLSAKDVQEIIEARGKITQVKLAEKYGVKQGHISKIQLGGVWESIRNVN